MIALIALRFVIGWHFFSEGSSKLRDPKPFSAGFLSGAKGPWANSFQNMAWDADGVVRLDRDRTWKAWDEFRNQVVRHYGFSEEQSKQAEAILAAYTEELDAILVDQKEEVANYFQGLERRDKNRSDPVRREVPSLKGQSETIESDLKKVRGGWLGKINKFWSGLEQDLNAIASSEQRSRGSIALAKPGRTWLDSERIDGIIPYFDLIVGLCLILGLFTRTAAIAAAAFLVSVMATQPPWVPESAPIYYQLVEATALVVVAVAGAGQHAGIDAILRTARRLCCPPKTGTPSNENANARRT